MTARKKTRRPAARRRTSAAYKSSWEDVDLFDVTTQSDVPMGRNATRVRALREYRENGSIYGFFLASSDDLEHAARRGLDTATLGPSVRQIDWAGFPGVRARKPAAKRPASAHRRPTTERRAGKPAGHKAHCRCVICARRR